MRLREGRGEKETRRVRVDMWCLRAARKEGWNSERSLSSVRRRVLETCEGGESGADGRGGAGVAGIGCC